MTILQPSKQELSEWEVNNFDHEDKFQAACVKMIKKYFPQLKNKVFHPKNEQHIPRNFNEDDDSYKKRCQIIGKQNEMKGKLAGASDLIIKYKGIFYSMELKQPKGKLNPDQIEVHKDWDDDFPEIPVFVAKNVMDAYKFCYWIVYICKYEIVKK